MSKVRIEFEIAEFISNKKPNGDDIKRWLDSIEGIGEYNIQTKQVALSDGIWYLVVETTEAGAEKIRNRLFQELSANRLFPDLSSVKVPSLPNTEEFVLFGPAYNFAYFSLDQLEELKVFSASASDVLRKYVDAGTLFMTFKDSWSYDEYLRELERRIRENDFSYNREINMVLEIMEAAALRLYTF